MHLDSPKVRASAVAGLFDLRSILLHPGVATHERFGEVNLCVEVVLDGHFDQSQLGSRSAGAGNFIRTLEVPVRPLVIPALTQMIALQNEGLSVLFGQRAGRMAQSRNNTEQPNRPTDRISARPRILHQQA